MDDLYYWDNPGPRDISTDAYHFLAQLPGPTIISIEGHDTGRTRVLVCLLTGGDKASVDVVHRFLCSGIKPMVNTLIILGDIDAATMEPMFTHDSLPGLKPLAFSFTSYNEDAQSILAMKIVSHISSFMPESIVVIYPSGEHSEPLCMITVDNRETLQLANIFTQHSVLVGRRQRGVIGEHQFGCSVVSVCYNDKSERFPEKLYECVSYYLTHSKHDSVDNKNQVYRTSSRVFSYGDVTVCTENQCNPEKTITLNKRYFWQGIEYVEADCVVAWCDEAALDSLFLISEGRESELKEHFVYHEGALYSRQPMFLSTASSYVDRHNGKFMFFFSCT